MAIYLPKERGTVTEMKEWSPDIQLKGKNILLEGKIRNRDEEQNLQ